MYPIKLGSLCALTSLCLAFSIQVAARSYVVKSFDIYTVRCSSIETSELPNAVIDGYNVLELSDDTGIVSCVLQSESAGQALSNVEGSFSGYMQNLIGHRKTLSFKPGLENSAVTYLATYERTSTSPVRFWITVSVGEVTYEFDFQDPAS